MVGYNMAAKPDNSRKFKKCIHNKIEEVCQTLTELSVEATEIIKEYKKDQGLENGRESEQLSDKRETCKPGSKARVS
jgi:hypothetical protein